MSKDVRKAYLYDNYETRFPWYARRTVSYDVGDAFELIVELDDGIKLSYYDPEGSIRILPNIRSDMQSKDVDRELNEYFGYRLKRIMGYRNISQAELADKLGVSQSQVSQYIHGKSTPSFGRLYMISKILECSVSDLLYKY